MNRIYVQYTEFVDLNDDGHAFESHYGYRIYDDYGQSYNNTFDTFNDLRENITSENVIEYIAENHPEFYDSILDHGGLYFNSEWIEVAN